MERYLSNNLKEKGSQSIPYAVYWPCVSTDQIPEIFQCNPLK